MALDLTNLPDNLYENMSCFPEGMGSENTSISQGGYLIRYNYLVWANCNPKLAHEYNQDPDRPGWRVHIAVNPDLTNVAQAFNIVLKAGIRNRILQFNCCQASILPQFAKRLEHEDARKIFTVYFYAGRAGQNKAIKQFLQEVEAGFKADKIKPSSLPESEVPIKGSKFFSYINNKGAKPSPDPFKDFAISPDNFPFR